MRRQDRTLKKFYATFEHYDGMTDDWQEEIVNYIVYGYPPGSFHVALFENNLADAACKSHPMNQWSMIISFMKWLLHYAPHNSWGSKEKVDAWLALSADERRKKCEDARILATAWELLQEKNDG